MSVDGWIVVPNWERFQHYTDRDPVWIKLYTELNSRDEWLALTTAERGLLVTIWLEYARSHGVLRVQKVASLCTKSARRKHFESLNHAGFIKVSASKPLALARSREEEVLRTSSKKKKPQQPQRGTAAAAAEEKSNAGADEAGEEIGRDPEALRKIRELAADLGLHK